MANFQYVVTETRAQAIDRKMKIQAEKAKLVRLFKDPKVQEIAKDFIKQGRLPEENEVYYLAEFFGDTHRNLMAKGDKINLQSFGLLDFVTFS